jgi:sarcosine oxidase subunit alpha
MSRGDVLVIGGGPAGLCAAVSAARNGADVTLIDEGPQLGGQLRYRLCTVQHPGTGEVSAASMLAEALEAAARAAGVRLMPRTTVWGAFADGSFGASLGDDPRLLSPSVTVLATGSTDLPVIFPGGSLAGVFTGRAALKLANEWGVLPGRRWAIVGRSRLPEIEESIAAAGGEVVVRAEVTSALRASGSPLLSALEIDGVTHEVDCVAIAAGRQPEATLALMSDVSFGYSAGLGGLVPVLDEAGRTALPNLLVCGDAAGACSPETAMAEGMVAGVAAAVEAGVASADALWAEQARLRDVLAARLEERLAIASGFVQPVR